MAARVLCPAGQAEPRKAAAELQPEVGQLELFGPTDRLPRRPYCADDLEYGLRIRSLREAITKPYIQINPPHLRVWSIYDVDRPGAAVAWEDVGLPPPAWAAVNRENAHAHLVWGLSAPVLVDGLYARDAPMRYLCAIESCFRERLQADPGYSGLITKNPLSQVWRVLRGPRVSYGLDEMGEYLPELERHRPRQGVKPERVGIGRNVALFDALRHWAYLAIRPYARGPGGLEAWRDWSAKVQVRAMAFNAEMFGTRMLDHREVWHIGKSISKWVWRRGREKVLESDARFSATQARRGRMGGVASGLSRAAGNEDKRASARLMRAQGYSSRAIAEAVEVNQSTVVRWLAG